MTAQELYNKFIKEHGCRSQSCSYCHCAFDFNKETKNFKCIIVVLTEALGLEAGEAS